MNIRKHYRPSTEAQRCEETAERNAVRMSNWYNRIEEYQRKRRLERRGNPQVPR